MVSTRLIGGARAWGGGDSGRPTIAGQIALIGSRIMRITSSMAFPSLRMASALSASYFLTVLGCIYVANEVNFVAPLWVPTSILLVAFFRSPVRTWPVLFLLACSAELVAQTMLGKDRWSIAIAVILANALAALFAAIPLRRFANNDGWYCSIRWMLQFTLSGILATALATGAFSASWALGLLGKKVPFLNPFVPNFITDALSILLVTPLFLCWTEPALIHGFTRRQLIETLFLTAIVGLVTHVTFCTTLPLLFLTYPLLALLTLRAGLQGATIGAITHTAIAALDTTHGNGPIAALKELGFSDRMLVLQVDFLAALFSTIPLAIVLALRARLADNLLQQQKISDAALNDMAQGLCMFDNEQRLVVCNRRFVELYDLPDHLAAPQTPFSAIVQHQVAASGTETPDSYLRELLAADEIKRERSEIELPDGRIIDIHRRQLDGGSWIATHQDITDNRRAANRIAYLAHHDSLTGLPNRASFHDRLQRLIAQSRTGDAFALHCIDLDRFKAVNDTLGHGIGDELLMQVSGRLQSLLGNGDLVARLGGDEFAMLQHPLTSTHDANLRAADVVQSLREPYYIRGHEVVIGASVGVARAPADTCEADDLLQKGDLALYRAKSGGRNTYCIFESEMDSELRARRVLESELRLAIQKGEFELYYQPVMDIERNVVSGFESVIQWHHPIRGTILPAEFLGIAEETGLSIPIGDWVIREACREAASWPEPVKVVVPLSPMQFKSRDLVTIVANALARAQLAADRLELEIAESLLRQETDTVIATLELFRGLGISISMRDFGTGFSSLSYLRVFPFDKIKIARSFVGDLEKDDCLAIVHATVALSTRLGMSTVAEGVETAEQLAILKAEGCGSVQGHYVSRPLPPIRVQEILNRYPSHRPPRRVRKRG